MRHDIPVCGSSHDQTALSVPDASVIKQTRPWCGTSGAVTVAGDRTTPPAEVLLSARAINMLQVGPFEGGLTLNSGASQGTGYSDRDHECG